jgi:predicted  nucleic acid-binding Zn-ribbon protein
MSKVCSRCKVLKCEATDFKAMVGSKGIEKKYSSMCKNCLDKNYNKVLNNQLENELFLKEVLNHPKVKEYYKGRNKTARDQGKIKAQETIDKLTKELQKSNKDFTEMNLRHQKAQETITELRKEISDNLIKIMKHLNVEANSF